MTEENVKTEDNLKAVCFFPADHWGCGFYRCMLPSIALCKQGIPAHIMTIDRIDVYNMASTLVVQRPADPSLLNLIEEANSNGIKTIVELDDNIWEVPEWNPSSPFWTSVRQTFFENTIKKCARAVTTTNTLATVLREFIDDVVVVPNAIYDNKYIDFPSHLKTTATITVGWIGSAFHSKDTEIFTSLIPIMLDKYPEIGFLMMGEGPPRELSGYSHRIMSLPFVEPIYYHQIINSFTIDIGLAPLLQCAFNRAKSPVKVIEYLYMKTFPICSDIDPYSDIQKENEDSCLLVPTSEVRSGTVDDWMDRIDFCVKNIEMIRKKAAKGREYILDKYNIESPKMVDIYRKAYFVD